MKIWTATLLRQERGGEGDLLDAWIPVIEGRSTGRAWPTWHDANTGEPLDLPWLDEQYRNTNLTGTGPIGQVRDMTSAMAAAARARPLKLEVPAQTAAKIEAEIERDQASLPEGAVW